MSQSAARAMHARVLWTHHGRESCALDPLAQVERLHALSASGAISGDEYEVKKAELLARM